MVYIPGLQRGGGSQESQRVQRLGLDLDAVRVEHDLLDQEVQVVLRHRRVGAEMKKPRMTAWKRAIVAASRRCFGGATKGLELGQNLAQLRMLLTEFAQSRCRDIEVLLAGLEG